MEIKEERMSNKGSFKLQVSKMRVVVKGLQQLSLHLMI